MDLAVESGDEYSVSTILMSGRMNIQNKEASSLLNIAEKNGHKGIVNLLKPYTGAEEDL